MNGEIGRGFTNTETLDMHEVRTYTLRSKIVVLRKRQSQDERTRKGGVFLRAETAYKTS